MSDRALVLKYQLECDKVQWLQTHCGQTWISLGRLLYHDILFLCPRSSSGPYISRNFLIWTHLVGILEKIGLTHAHFQYNLRKLVNVVKVRFALMLSSRKLNNKRVITTACNFWRQIACSFQVYCLTNHFCSKSTRKTLFWISRFFSPHQHWPHKMFFPTIFPTALRR